jgi:alpha/beta superfamily hydrolase
MPEDNNRTEPQPLSLTTSDGLALEAEMARPSGYRAAVVLAHPHPAQGGSMRSLVTSELFRNLPGMGLATLRFNFRGVEGSDGEHAGGVDEHLDIEAAVAELAASAPDVPLFTAGWSFGADVSLTVADPLITGWFLIAPPLRVVRESAMVAAQDPRPKLLVVGEHDQFRPPISAETATAAWTNTEVVAIPGADHFFAGRTDRVAELAAGFADRLIAETTA